MDYEICIGTALFVKYDNASKDSVKTTNEVNVANVTDNSENNDSKENKTIQKDVEDNTNNKEENNEENDINTSHNQNEMKSSAKDYVEDSNIIKNKQDKTVTLNEYGKNETVKASEKIIVPHIKIDSDEARKANQEIEKMANEQYELFGKKDGEDTYYITSMDYLCNYTGGSISILLFYDSSISYTDGNGQIIKTFNISTTKQGNNNSDLSRYGYSKETIESRIKEFYEKNVAKRGEQREDKLEVVDGQYYLGQDNSVFVVCKGGFTSGGVRSSNQYTLINITKMDEIPYYSIRDILNYE